MDYKEAGVDINKANDMVDKIKEMAKHTSSIGDIGGFGGLFPLDNYKIENPVLVSSTDGVGTKLKLAFMIGIHNTVGIDLVAMSVNDIIVQGAKPLFFLDYLSTGKLQVDIATEIIQGIVEGCKQANCTLIGGETAEMPGFYAEGEYDLAGFAVGIINKNKIIDGSRIARGDKLIGIASSGLHSNGFSLVRKICFDTLHLNINDYMQEFGTSLGEELIKPTKIYVNAINNISKDITILGMAHITGGGLMENIFRVIPEDCDIVIDTRTWLPPPIFTFLQKYGNVSEQEMIRTFNNGIGMVLIVRKEDEQDVLEKLDATGEKSYVIGEVIRRSLCAGKRAGFIR